MHSHTMRRATTAAANKSNKKIKEEKKERNISLCFDVKIKSINFVKIMNCFFSSAVTALSGYCCCCYFCHSREAFLLNDFKPASNYRFIRLSGFRSEKSHSNKAQIFLAFTQHLNFIIDKISPAYFVNLRDHFFPSIFRLFV